MVDYSRATGTAGRLIIRDEGQLSFWISCSDSATNAASVSWSGKVNGVNVGGTFSWPSGGGTRRIAGGWDINTTQTVTFSIGGTGTQGLGGPTSFSQKLTRALPAAPSLLMITRVSESQHRLNWNRNSVYTSVVVQRRTNNGAWQQVGVPGGNASTFTDKTTQANRKYDYRVASRAASGQSGWSNTATVYTTPAVPTGVSAARQGDDIRVSASGFPPYATSYDVRDGSTVVGSSVSLPWTHAAPNPAVPHTYTVRAKRGSLASGYSAASNTVQLVAPPNAPAGLSPNGAVRASDADVLFQWVHNPVDSSDQSAYELRYRVSAGAWTTIVGTTDSEREVTLEVGAYEWQVRTKGAHPDWSPWSATAVVTVADRPGVAIEQPEDVWDSSVLPVQWSWFQGQGRPQSSWRVELLDDSLTVVESRSGAGAGTSVTLNRRLSEGDWTVRVRAATGDVWSEWAETVFTVVFDPPAVPLISGVWDEAEGVVALTVAPGEDEEVPATVMLVLERSVAPDVWELVAEVSEESALSDGESLSYGDTEYRLTAFTAEGATAAVTTTVPARSGALWLSGGIGFGVTGRLPFDPAVSVTAGRQRTVKQYAGRSLPVAYSGEAISTVVAVSGRTLDRDEETADVEQLTRIAQLEQDRFLFRDPDGRRIYGTIGEIQLPRESSTPHEDGWEGLWGYSFTLTETEPR